MMVKSKAKNPTRESVAVLAYMVLIYNIGERPLFNAYEVREMARNELNNIENCCYSSYAIICGLLDAICYEGNADAENVQHAVQYAYQVLGL